MGYRIFFVRAIKVKEEETDREESEDIYKYILDVPSAKPQEVEAAKGFVQ